MWHENGVPVIQDQCFDTCGSKIKADSDPCWNQYCALSFQCVLWTLLARKWLFCKGAPIVLFQSLSHCTLKAFIRIQCNERFSSSWRICVVSPFCPIQLKRHDNIQQQTPLQNTVMQITFSDISLGSNKEKSPKVSSCRRAPESSTFYFPVCWFSNRYIWIPGNIQQLFGITPQKQVIFCDFE